MSYVLPTWGPTCNIWYTVPPWPPGPPPDNAGVKCNLALGRRISEGGGVFFGGMWLLLPPLTSIAVGGYVEVPAGSGRVYNVPWVDDIGKGFANEHRFALIVADYPNWPAVPYP